MRKRKEPPLSLMLNDPNKGVHKARGALAKLFRGIVREFNIGMPEWYGMVDRYLDRIERRNRGGKRPLDRGWFRGNLNKELSQYDMSGKVFMKGLEFIDAEAVRIEVHLIKNGEYHCVGLDLYDLANGNLDPDWVEKHREEAAESRGRWIENTGRRTKPPFRK